MKEVLTMVSYTEINKYFVDLGDLLKLNIQFNKISYIEFRT